MDDSSEAYDDDESRTMIQIDTSSQPSGSKCQTKRSNDTSIKIFSEEDDA